MSQSLRLTYRDYVIVTSKDTSLLNPQKELTLGLEPFLSPVAQGLVTEQQRETEAH